MQRHNFSALFIKFLTHIFLRSLLVRLKNKLIEQLTLNDIQRFATAAKRLNVSIKHAQIIT